MSKADLQLSPNKPAETSSNNSSSPTQTETKASKTTHTEERTRNDFTAAQNPFASIRKKKLRESGLKELNNFRSTPDTSLTELDSSEDKTSQTSGLTVSKSSIVNEERETFKNLEGRSKTGDLVINSGGNALRDPSDIASKQFDLLLAEQQREREVLISRKETAFKTTTLLAVQSAREHFQVNPNQIITTEEFQTKLQKITSLINSDQTLVNQIQEEFLRAYVAERDKLYGEMSWIKQKYYQATGWVSEKLNTLKDLTIGIVDTSTAVCKGITKLVSGACKLVANLDWDKIKETSWTMLSNCGEALSDPNFYLKVLEGTGKATLWVLKQVGTAIVNIITDPIGALEGTWKFVKQMSSSMGLSQLINGAWCAVKAPYQYCIDLVRPGGGFAYANENLKNNLIAVKDGVIGGLKCVCEITGLADCYYTLKHGSKALILYGQGRNLEAALEAGQAVMHLAFAVASASSIIATVSTLGAASGTVALVATGRLSLSEGIERVGKHAFKAFGKELAETALSKVPKTVLEEATEKASREAGETLAKETIEIIAKTSSAEITKDTAEIIVKNVGIRAAELGQIAGREIIEKSGLSKALTESAEMLFSQLQHGSKDLTKQLIENGISKAQAKAMTHTASGLFRSNATKKEIVEILTSEASKHIAKEVEENATKHFLKSFEKSLASAMISNLAFKESFEAIAKAAGISSSEFMSKLAESAAKGFKEGLIKGISEAVELAIKKALTRSRFASKVRSSGAKAGRIDENNLADLGDYCLEDLIELSEREETKPLQLKNARLLNELDKKFEIEVKDGSIIRVEYYILDSSKIYTGKRDIIGVTQQDFN